MTTPLPASYFDGLYAADPDPWRIAGGWYEQRKRDLTLAALPDATYARAFEPGCGGGLLTVELARRCRSLLACDISPVAVQQTRQACAGNAAVDVRQAALPDGWPDGRFDLVVCSEVLYYLGEAGVDATAELVAGALEPGGAVVAVHWRHRTNYPQSGEAAQETFGKALGMRGLRHLASWRDEDLVLETWSSDRRSVAAREGLDVEGTGP